MATIGQHGPHKQEFSIRDLPTRQVILFPVRAQVVREIKAIRLESGANQVVIFGLSPTVDEHSIQVEGAGDAKITEVNVELVPNREVYEDIYPSDDEDSDLSDASTDDEDDASIKKIDNKIEQLNLQRTDALEQYDAAMSKIEALKAFSSSMSEHPPESHKLHEVIDAYGEERAKAYDTKKAAVASMAQLDLEIDDAIDERSKVSKALAKANRPAVKAKMKKRALRLRKAAEKAQAKKHLKDERYKFWPKMVYRVAISLDTATYTPATSRRGSIDSETTITVPKASSQPSNTFHQSTKEPLASGQIDLSIAYMTYSASWSPRYDLSLNTLNSTGLLDYGAELVNTSSETWKDAKLILSTSQTSFAGLSEAIPILHPWHVRLQKGYNANGATSSLVSAAEMSAKHMELSKRVNSVTQKPRKQLFGRTEHSVQQASAYLGANTAVPAPVPAMHTMQLARAPPPPGVQAAAFGSSVQNAQFSLPSTFQVRECRARSSMPPGRGGKAASASRMALDESTHEEEAEETEYDPTIEESANPVLAYEEGDWEEVGLTTTYEVPGNRTLAPSNSSTKHKIARVEFKNIIFSHIVVGKLRQVAFLKARMKNASKIALLKGPMGLTLDGSFLGQSTLPRCSSGESFSLSLGVDPTIAVVYTKPTVHRSQSGIFSKEESHIFTRVCTIRNTRPNKTAEITVLDQVPVSEDERLKIEIAYPTGLKPGGSPVKAGTNVENEAGKWGSAQMDAKKNGEVAWKVFLDGNKAVRLTLQYTSTHPGNESIVGV